MNSSKLSTLLSILLALTWAVLAASAQQPPPPPTSAANSPSSDTGASKSNSYAFRHEPDATNAQPAPAPLRRSITPKGETLTAACNAAADELKATRTLVSGLESENAALKQRLETEQRITALLTELDQTRTREAEALRSTIASQSATIQAKDSVLAAQDKLITELRRKKSSPWKRVMDVLIGVGVGAMLR